MNLPESNWRLDTVVIHRETRIELAEPLKVMTESNRMN